MIIIDRDKSVPIFTRVPHPEKFKTTYERDKYWDREDDYYHNGYNVDINGMLYYYLTNVKLKHRNTGREYYPECRDVELITFKELEYGYKNGEVIFIVKGRGVGLSSMGMGLVPYFMRVLPGSHSLATSKSLSNLATIFSEKFVFAYNNLHPDIRPSLINLRNTENKSYFKGGVKYINSEGREAMAESELMCRDTQESDEAASNFSGAGVIYGFGDEAPLMKRFNKFFGSAIECFTDHSINRIVGLLLLGGTVEKDIKSEDINRLKKIWDTAKARRIRTIFLPATYGKHVVNGWSNHARAKEEILKRREELEIAEQQGNLGEEDEGLAQYIKNNPLTLDEVFDIARGDFWSEETADAMKRQRIIINNSDPKYLSYKVVDLEGKVHLERDNKSKILIHERPLPDVKYVLGIDGTATSKQGGTKKGSLFAAVMWRHGFNGMDDAESYKPVAIMAERPDDIEQCYRKATNLAKLYNEFNLCKIMAEGNAGTTDHYGSFLKKEGLYHLAMRDPENPSKTFKYRTEQVKDWQKKEGNIVFKKFAGRIWFPELIESLLRSDGDDGDDLRDAILMCLVGAGKYKDVSVETQRNIVPNTITCFNRKTGMYEIKQVGQTPEEWLQQQKIIVP